MFGLLPMPVRASVLLAGSKPWVRPHLEVPIRPLSTFNQCGDCGSLHILSLPETLLDASTMVPQPYDWNVNAVRDNPSFLGYNSTRGSSFPPS